MVRVVLLLGALGVSGVVVGGFGRLFSGFLAVVSETTRVAFELSFCFTFVSLCMHTLPQPVTRECCNILAVLTWHHWLRRRTLSMVPLVVSIVEDEMRIFHVPPSGS